jgi:hypothetical protein
MAYTKAAAGSWSASRGEKGLLSCRPACLCHVGVSHPYGTGVAYIERLVSTLKAVMQHKHPRELYTTQILELIVRYHGKPSTVSTS